MSAASAASATPDLLAAFIEHNDVLGGQPAYRRQRLAAARAFLDVHPDLGAWMAAPVDARLVELRRRPFAWQLVSFAIVSGWCRADAEFLFAKNFGHSVARWIAALFPADVARLNEVATRLGAACPEVAVREVLSLAVAFAGRPPSSLTAEDLDALSEAIDTTPRLTGAMRRGRRGQLFRLRRLVFEAGMVDLPAQHRREGGPATRQARLAAVASPEIRRTLLAHLDVRSTVLRPKTIEKITSALAIFGEFICDHDPTLSSLARVSRHHCELDDHLRCGSFGSPGVYLSSEADGAARADDIGHVGDLVNGGAAGVDEHQRVTAVAELDGPIHSYLCDGPTRNGAGQGLAAACGIDEAPAIEVDRGCRGVDQSDQLVAAIYPRRIGKRRRDDYIANCDKPWTGGCPRRRWVGADDEVFRPDRELDVLARGVDDVMHVSPLESVEEE
jgi:hypothetical protein